MCPFDTNSVTPLLIGFESKFFLFRFPKLECSIAVMFFGLVVDVIFDVGVLFCGRDIEIAVMFPSQKIRE